MVQLDYCENKVHLKKGFKIWMTGLDHWYKLGTCQDCIEKTVPVCRVWGPLILRLKTTLPYGEQ